jgi:hypothetical protein
MFSRKKPSSSVAASSRSASQSSNHNGSTTSGGGGGVATSSLPSPVLIQKFIVLHEGLMPLPDHRDENDDDDPRHQRRRRRNPASMLSEDASLDEHGEFILYYYDHALNAPRNGGRRSHSSVVDNNDTDNKRRRSSLLTATSDDFEENLTTVRSHASEDAVRFAGVCRALRSLPTALRPQKYGDGDGDDDNDNKVDGMVETEVVHLSDSTLVFVPLELDGDIVAIAQLPRAINRCNLQRQASNHHQSKNFAGGDNNLRSNLGYGADPSAIQEAIRQIHSFFSLMHGGGIHRRLLRTRHLEQSSEWAMEVEDDKGNGSTYYDANGKGSANGQSRRRSSRAMIRRNLSNSVHSTDSATNNGFYQDSNGAIRKSSIAHNPNLQDYRYGGMKELFDLRREYREIQNKQREEVSSSKFGGVRRMSSMWGSSANAEDLFAGIANEFGHNDCLNRIDKLLEVLPITKLREDLECFYDEWLWRMQGVCDIMTGGVGRCVVEMIPAPLFSLQSSAMRDIPVRGQHPPLAPQSFVCLAGAEFMKSLISDELPQLNGGSGLQFSRLLGMSLFYHNRFVLSKMKNEKKGLFPPEIPCIVAEYFHSYSQRDTERNFMAEITKQAAEPRDNTVSRHNHNALERWMSNISLNPDDKVNLSPLTPTPMEVFSGFAPPPAAFETDNKEHLPSFFVPDLNRQVWLPNLHPPCPTASQIIEHDDAIETHVAMFGKGDFTFLLFFEMQDPYGGGSILEQMAEEMNPRGDDSEEGTLITGEDIEEEAKAFATLLTFLDSQISEFCDTFSERDSADSVSNPVAPVKEINSHRLFQGETGMDIIHINRNENSFILLSQHDLSSNQFKRVANEPATNETKPKLLFGLGQKGKQEEQERTTTYRPTHHSDILDCRHKLAAYLPLDVMLAFDDMFNEVGRLSHRRNVLSLTMNDAVSKHNSTEDSSSNIKAIELCTFLPQGWVYCHANGEQELYILLDTSKFVTIADVQKAVVRVRERITSLP